MADRYTYVPLIGIFIAAVWLVAEISIKWPYRRQVLTLLAVGILAACWQRTATQVCYWRDSETLARRALAVTTDNGMMQGLLGSALFEQGKTRQAGEHFAAAARIWPDNVTAQCDLALALVAQGRLDEAAAACENGLKYKPQSSQLHELLASTLSRQGNLKEAIEEYKMTLQLAPDQLMDLNNLAWLLATAPEAGGRDGAEAVRQAEQACQLTHYQRPLFVGTLAAAYAAAGRFEEAVTMAQKAIALATAAKNEGLVRKNRELLGLYQHRQADHEPAGH
jgi:tetratricopeptide (TPR) repeat protein